MDEADFKRKLDQVGAQVDASTDMWVIVHVIYEQMIEAGFTLQQACIIIGVWFGHATGGSAK